jgi:hypothetical protein
MGKKGLAEQGVEEHFVGHSRDPLAWGEKPLKMACPCPFFSSIREIGWALAILRKASGY